MEHENLERYSLTKFQFLKVSDKENEIFKSLITDIQDDYKKEKAILIDERLFELYGLSKEERITIGFVEIQ